jgi:hypothetical protein
MHHGQDDLPPQEDTHKQEIDEVLEQADREAEIDRALAEGERIDQQYPGADPAAIAEEIEEDGADVVATEPQDWDGIE